MQLLLIYAFAFCLGACVGSFLNVCIYRLPRQMSLLKPRSHCPHCGVPLSARDLIPLLSILLLFGKCRYCKHPISYRYFLVELLTALCAVLSYHHFLRLLGQRVNGSIAIWDLVIGHWSLVIAALLTFVTLAALIVVFFVDFDFYIIPDQTVWAIALCGVLAQVVRGGLGGGLPQALWGALVGGGALLLVAWLGGLLFKKEAMGLGDVKLSAAMGAHLGASWLLLGYFLMAAFLGVGIGLALRRSLHGRIPFGPMLSVSAAICLLFPKNVEQVLASLFYLP